MSSEKMLDAGRRELITAGMALVASAGLPLPAFAKSRRLRPVPAGFLWGTATAAHQVEGNNIASDFWVAEHVAPTVFKEPSGDACDSFHRYEEDIAIVAKLGLDTYRYSIDWSRIEPEPGTISMAMLDHYKRMGETCRKHGVKPAITFHHFVSPKWIAMRGGWLEPDNAKRFADFCSLAARHLASDAHIAATLNEPDSVRQFRWFSSLGDKFLQFRSAVEAMEVAAAKATGSNRFSFYFNSESERQTATLISAHKQGYAAIKAERSNLPVGVCLAVMDYQGVGKRSRVAEARADVHGQWFEASKTGDFVGVQNYSRILIGPDGPLPVPEGAATSSVGLEVFPASLGNAVRTAHAATGLPVLVSENGIATNDDAVRVAYIDKALAGLGDAITDGVPVIGYIHWSLLDNFEWMSGYDPKFGLVSVDRKSFVRTIKPSGNYLGAIAKRGTI